jgi:hypothetical protein
MLFEFDSLADQKAHIKVIGVGGAGGNAVNRMIASGPSERRIAAKERFDGAMREAGRGLSDVLWRVVCACESLPSAEKTLKWPARSGKLVLGIALDRVAGFYRL